MVRTSLGLCVATVESLFLSLVAYFALSAFMDQFMATDFSPAMRSVLFIQLVLTILHASSQLIISVTDKMAYVASQQSPINDYGSSENYAAASELLLVSGLSEQQQHEQRQKALMLLQQEQAAQKKANLLIMLASRTDYRHALYAANGYCTFTMLLLLAYMCMFLQCLYGYGLSTTIEQRTRGGGLGSSAAQSPTSYHYSSCQRLDWIQAVVGASGWQRQVHFKVARTFWHLWPSFPACMHVHAYDTSITYIHYGTYTKTPGRERLRSGSVLPAYRGKHLCGRGLGLFDAEFFSLRLHIIRGYAGRGSVLRIPGAKGHHARERTHHIWRNVHHTEPLCLLQG
jgi:hypothetical protein